MIKFGATYLKKAPATLTSRAVAYFSNNKTAWDEKERSAEKQFFNKEEGKYINVPILLLSIQIFISIGLANPSTTEKLLKKLSEKLQRERYVAESGKSEADFKSEQVRKVKVSLYYLWPWFLRIAV